MRLINTMFVVHRSAHKLLNTVLLAQAFVCGLLPAVTGQHHSSTSSYISRQEHTPMRPLDSSSDVPPMHQRMRQLQQTGVSFGDAMLLKGFKASVPGSGRNWGLLARKLVTPGSTVTVVTYGGSVTAGHFAGTPDGSWVEHLTDWLQSSYPQTTFKVLNLARNSTSNVAGGTCWWQYTPVDADLVIVEWSINSCTYITCSLITQPLVVNYEMVLRRTMRHAPRAAFMSLAAFRFSFLDDAAGTTPSGKVPNPYYNSGEDMHAAICRRYGVPMMSVRDVLYDIIWDDAVMRATTGFTRSQILIDDVHPSIIGNKIYARLLSFGIRRMLAAERLPQSTTLEPPALPEPLSPAVARQDALSYCQEGELFRAYLEAGNLAAANSPFPANVAGVSLAKPAGPDTVWLATPLPRLSGSLSNNDGSLGGWVWNDAPYPRVPGNPNSYAFGLQGRGIGAYVDIRINTQTPAGARTDWGTKYTRDAARLAQQLDQRSLYVFFNQGASEGRNRMGVAELACVSGCTCQPVTLEGNTANTGSAFGYALTQITPHPECIVRVTIKGATKAAINNTPQVDDASTSSSVWFKIFGIAVVPYSDARLPKTELDVWLAGRMCQSGNS